jgi:hypothetical protein
MARRIREPSCRNLIVYIGAVVKKVTQKRVADQFGIGQGRVSQIVGRVRAWVDQVVGERHFRKQPALRFYLAICKERLRLEQMYGPVMTIYDERTERERYARRYVAVVNGQPTPTVEITDAPPAPLRDLSFKVALRLNQLETISQDGPFPDFDCSIKQWIVHSHGAEDESAAQLEDEAQVADESFVTTKRGDSDMRDIRVEPAAHEPLNSDETMIIRGAGLITGDRFPSRESAVSPAAATACSASASGAATINNAAQIPNTCGH